MLCQFFLFEVVDIYYLILYNYGMFIYNTRAFSYL